MNKYTQLNQSSGFEMKHNSKSNAPKMFGSNYRRSDGFMKNGSIKMNACREIHILIIR